jgi:hypothetical protein
MRSSLILVWEILRVAVLRLLYGEERHSVHLLQGAVALSGMLATCGKDRRGITPRGTALQLGSLERAEWNSHDMRFNLFDKMSQFERNHHSSLRPHCERQELAPRRPACQVNDC